MQGKRATTHWAYRHLLDKVGAIREDARVVRDGDVFTGGGVTAGIDFALTLVAEIAGVEVAQSLQLGLEYDPHPPFTGGSPERAPKEILARTAASYETRSREFAAELEAAVRARR